MSQLITDSAKLQGAMILAFFTAVPLTLVLSLVTRVLYRRAVHRAMFGRPDSGNRAGPSPGRPIAVLDPPIPAPDRRPLVSELVPLPAHPNVRYRLGIRYLVAGLAYGTSATVALFLIVEDIDFLPVRFLAVAMTLSWPAIPAALHFAGLSLGRVALGAIGYTALLFPAGLAGGIGVQIFLIPLVLVLPAAVVALILANRVMRTTSLVMFMITLSLLIQMLFALDLVLLIVLDVGAIAIPAALLLTTGLGVTAGLLATKGLAAVTARSSDLTIQSDTIWLVVTYWLITLNVRESGAAALAMLIPFAVYRLTLHLMGRRSPDPDAPLLLLLRVFGNRRGQEKLSFGMLTHWRQFGPVVLVGAGDLATETLDPPELSAFLGFSTPSMFIKSAEDLDRRLNESSQPTSDGLYPVRDYYCQGDIWQLTATVLMSRAATIILDLRGFGSANAGTRWEIGQLVRRVPIERVVVLCDESTDLAYASQLFAYEWHQHTGVGLGPPGRQVPLGAATLRFNMLS